MHWIILKEVNTVEKNKTSKLNDIEIYILYIIIKREAQRAKCLKKKKKWLESQWPMGQYKAV